MAVLTGVILLSSVVGFGFGAAHSARRHDHSSGALLLALGSGIVFAAAAGLCGLWLYRRPTYQRVLQFGWGRRRRVGRALRRGRPVAAQDMPVAHAIMRTMREQKWQRWIYPIVPAVMVLNGLDHHGVARWLWFAAGLFYALLVPWTIRLRRRMQTNYDRLVAAGE